MAKAERPKKVTPVPAQVQRLERDDLQRLFDVLTGRGYMLVAPIVREGAVAYDEVRRVDDLPIGWTDEQDGGNYSLKRRQDLALFGYTVGPHSWKKLLHPPRAQLWSAKQKLRGFDVADTSPDAPKYAFIGVRSCELHAIAIQDRVFLGGPHTDPIYKARRDSAFVVAVNCGQAGGTCFCVSMETGPKASFGFDIALTEVLEGKEHYFSVEVGTKRGADVLKQVPHREASAKETAAAGRAVARAAAQMGRSMDTADIKGLLYRNYENTRWNEVAARCLTCGNCTLVCPTCFCTTVEDVTDLKGEQAERWRRWDSCFTMDFTYIHGGSIRASNEARYRQWLTHKLGTWIDQFGTSGCVGCGRCITWCPVGIDITEEVGAIRASEQAPVGGRGGKEGKTWSKRQ
jgi:sulfhydrogenase subunit beta (sulfur reductase)